MKFRYFDLILGAFAVTLIISNIASVKIASIQIGNWHPSFDGGTILFPITYIFGDILTEVYGYARSRRVIWFGLAASLFSALIFSLIVALPADKTWNNQGSFAFVLGQVPQIVIASLVAFFVGEFLNAFVLAKLKIATKGRFLWIRTIGSTLIGEGADTLTFSWLAFGIGSGALPAETVWSIIIFNYIYKVGIEVLLTPVTYFVVAKLKRSEGIDVYDNKTNFNPFSLKSD